MPAHKNKQGGDALNRHDLEHKLQKGSILYWEGIPTYKVSLGQMADYGYTVSQSIISLLCMEEDAVRRYLPEETKNPSVFLFLAYNTLTETRQIRENKIQGDAASAYLCACIPSFLSLVFQKPVTFHEKHGFLIGEEKTTDRAILDAHNYDALRQILKERNCLTDTDGLDDSGNPAGEAARKLLEKRRYLREKVRQLKRSGTDSEDALTMADLISIFAEAEHMPLQEVYDRYDIYQFNNQFNRLKIMDDFRVNIQALLAGAKSDNMKLKHWLSKINSTEN